VTCSFWGPVTSDLVGLLETHGPRDEGRVGMKSDYLFTDYFTNEEGNPFLNTHFNCQLKLHAGDPGHAIP